MLELIDNEEIYKLREEGLTYKEIVEYFKQRGITVTSSTINNRIKEIYSKLDKEVPKGYYRRMLEEMTDEEIYDLREKGLTHKEIVQHFGKKGIRVSISTIQNRCKEIYLNKCENQPRRKSRKRIEKVSDEEVYKLREQGLSQKEIVEYLKNKGITVSASHIQKICKEIYLKKGKEQPKRKAKHASILEKISNEEVYNLREQGLRHKEISEYFEKKGIIVGVSHIQKICKEVYLEKGKEQPKVLRKKVLEEIADKEFLNLRENGFSYKRMEQYFAQKGIFVSSTTIQKRCKEIYKEQSSKAYTKITNEEIYNLREQGLSQKEIEYYFERKGINVTSTFIQVRCKKIYAELGKEQPKTKREPIKEISDEEIYELSQQGLNNKKIAEHFREKGIRVTDSFIKTRVKEIYEYKRLIEKESLKGKWDEEIYRLVKSGLTCKEIATSLQQRGIKITPSTISNRYKKMCLEKAEKEPKQEIIEYDNKQLVNGILKLVTTRNATVEQIKKIAEYYNVDLNEVFDKTLDER